MAGFACLPTTSNCPRAGYVRGAEKDKNGQACGDKAPAHRVAAQVGGPVRGVKRRITYRNER